MALTPTVSSRLLLGLGVAVAVVGIGGPLAWIALRDRPVEVAPTEPSPYRPEMVWLPPGTFTMGSPLDEPGRLDNEDLVEMTLGYHFAIGRTEVTQGQWKAVMGGNPSWFVGERVPDGVDADDLPVERVTWCAALMYCNRLSALEGLAPCYALTDREGDPNDGGGEENDWSESGFACHAAGDDLLCPGYRLPTEVEWAYAARAGTRSRYWSGEAEADLARVAWYSANSDRRTHPVGARAQNPWGLFDVHGNVWEWVLDGFEMALEARVDTAPAHDLVRNIYPRFRAYRGCGWGRRAAGCRAANRAPQPAANRTAHLGFRVAKTRPSSLDPSDTRPSESTARPPDAPHSAVDAATE